jgi:hypothetical protein
LKKFSSSLLAIVVLRRALLSFPRRSSPPPRVVARRHVAHAADCAPRAPRAPPGVAPIDLDEGRVLLIIGQQHFLAFFAFFRTSRTSLSDRPPPLQPCRSFVDECGAGTCEKCRGGIVLWQAYSPMGRQINFRIWHFNAEGIENRADILATTPREGSCALGHVLDEAKRRSTAASS